MVQLETTMHVVPVADLVEHDVLAESDCICGPMIEWMIGTVDSVKLVTHHSLDGREHNEKESPPVSAGEDS